MDHHDDYYQKQIDELYQSEPKQGMPPALFLVDQEASAVLSSYSQFMAASNGKREGAIAYGAQASSSAAAAAAGSDDEFDDLPEFE